MESMLEFLVVLPSAVMAAVGAMRAVLDTPAEWRAEMPVRVSRPRPVLVHDSARGKLLRSPGVTPSRAAGARLRLVYNGG